ncbi:MAG: hypothetical protein HY238_13295 [Acidobacteria bacterium]|nr:hypothetical protein [Acidobacteriota bacterium]
MSTTWKTLVSITLWAVLSNRPGSAQVAPATILEIDLENVVQYFQDIPDLSKFATDPNATTAVRLRNFDSMVFIGDIVAINGQPAKGTLIRNARFINLTTAPNPGQAIADNFRAVTFEGTFDILKVDGNPIGSIMHAGVGPGTAAPGAPLSVTVGNFAIVGGTGAFLGARGQLGRVTPVAIADRQASMAEDPANRRRNGGGRVRYVLHLIPVSRPEVVNTAGGPAVAHSSDFALVSTSKPAAAGEVLSLFATGLGPTRPGVDPGKPFPASPPAAVNSPVEVLVNGKPAEVLGAVGFPGAVDGYQVNFRVPPDMARGTTTIQVRAAWIAGSEVKISVQ